MNKRLHMFNNVRMLKRMSVDYLGGKCKHCGIKDDIVDIYDLHHRIKREFLISILITRTAARKKIFYIPDNLIKELNKCDLLCSNCHRKLHYHEKKKRIQKGLPAYKECKGRPRNQIKLNQILEMRKTMSIQEISDKLNCSRQNIYRALEKFK